MSPFHPGRVAYWGDARDGLSNVSLDFTGWNVQQCGMTVQDLIRKAGGVGKLAALCRVHHSTVCDWKRSNFLPGHRVPQISAALNINAADLMVLVRLPEPRRPLERAA